MTTNSNIRYEDLRHLFLAAVERTRQQAQAIVEEELPRQCLCLMAADSTSKELLSLDEALDRMYRSGAFPRIVDLAVCGVRAGNLLVWIRPSAHPWTTDLGETWNQPPGAGPFKTAGLMLPSHMWDREQPFRLSDLQEAADQEAEPSQ